MHTNLGRPGARGGQTGDRDADGARLTLVLLERIERRAPDNHADQVRRICVLDPLLPNEAAVPQNDDAVGDAENFVETVRNVDHADAARFQRAHRGEEPRDLIGRQAGGGFVQNEKVAVDHERPRDRHKRFLRAAQRLDARVRLHVAADPAKRVPSSPVAFRPSR